MDTNLHHTMKRCSGSFECNNSIKVYVPCYIYSNDISGCCSKHRNYIYNKKYERGYVMDKINCILETIYSFDHIDIKEDEKKIIKLVHLRFMAQLVCRHKGILNDEFIYCITKKLIDIEKDMFSYHIKYLHPTLCRNNREYSLIEKDLGLYYNDDMDRNVTNMSIVI